MIATQILNILKSRKYCRIKIENNIALLNTINYFVEQNRPINLVGYWGIMDKDKVDDRDKRTVEQLQEINKRIKQAYKPGLIITFIIADTHAKANGFSNKNYQKEIISLFESHNNIDYIFASDLSGEYTKKEISGELKTILENSAKRIHKEKYLYPLTKYLRLRITDADAIEKTFRNSIFFSYNRKEYKEIFPRLPYLLLFVYDRTNYPPWMK